MELDVTKIFEINSINKRLKHNRTAGQVNVLHFQSQLYSAIQTVTSIQPNAIIKNITSY